MNGEQILGLKVDVDTRRGMVEGVPALLSLLSRWGVQATFFLSFGPDNSGKALYRILTTPRFLLKMIRTNAPRLYGLRTALYGTLLKAPTIGLAFPQICREIEAKGHEVALHAWDHRGWQDLLPRKGEPWIREWLGKGVAAYDASLGHPPRAFGAPGWLLSTAAVAAVAAHGWEYVSCTRAKAPFIYAGTGLLEVPSDLPCLEEEGGRAGVERILSAMASGSVHILPAHAEVEGGILGDAFAEILREAGRLGFRFARLSEIASIYRTMDLPRRPFRLVRLKGRAFPCAV